MGWLGLVIIETINYTFFIIGEFKPAITYEMLYCSFIGFGITHLFRLYLKRTDLFKKRKNRIWMSALITTLLLSILMTLLTSIPGLIIKKEYEKFFTFVYIGGATMNWMRYVGVWIIIYFMYKILQENSQIQKEKLALENIAKTTELELLKHQLNPHFLFNALNTIKALVIVNPDESRNAIVKLSELLRFTLQYGKENIIPLKDELSEVMKYLDLEKLRFGKRLNVNYDISEDTLSQTVPPAIVLTLVENSIKHGVALQMEESLMSIKTYLYKGDLFIEVLNPGKYNPKNTNGIGLKHINKRLEEIYNHKSTFTILQNNNNVKAIIQLPAS